MSTNFVKRLSPSSLSTCSILGSSRFKVLGTVKSVKSFGLKKNNSNIEERSTFYHQCLNEKGLTLIAPLLFCLVFSLGTLLIFKSLKENGLVKERAAALLCLREQESAKRSYVQKMALFNSLLTSIYPLTYIPPAAPFAKKTHTALKHVQQLYHIAHLKKPFSFKNCPSLFSLVYINSLPYKSKAKVQLTRRLDGSVPLRKKKWRELLWSKRKKYFFKSDFSLKSHYATSPKVKRKEFSKEALQNWRESFGLPF